MRFPTNASSIPANMQMSQEGKNEPRILNVGAPLQPPRATLIEHAATPGKILCEVFTGIRSLLSRFVLLWLRLDRFYLNQVAGSECQICHLQQQLRACENVLGSRLRQGFLGRNHVEEIAHAISIGLVGCFIRLLRSGEQSSG